MSHSLKFRTETQFPGIIVYKTVFSNILPDVAETASVRQNQTGEDIFVTQTKNTNNLIHPASIIINAFVLALCPSKSKTNKLRYEIQTKKAVNNSV